MNTSLGRRQHLRTPVHRAGLMLSLLSAFLLSVLPLRVEAAVYSGSAGRVGAVTLNGPMIIGSDYRTSGLYGTSLWWKVWEAGSYAVGASPSSGALQRVVGVTEIQKWTGSWTVVQSRTFSGTVSSGGTLRFPSWAWNPTQQPNNQFGYRVVFHLAWRVASTGTLLAYTSIVPSTLADNRCRMLQLRCSAFTDGIRF